MNGSSRKFGTNFGGALVCMIALTLIAAPAIAQQRAGKQRNLWWNDNGVVVRLKLTTETRAKMDEVYAAHQPAIDEVKVGRLRVAFIDTLKSGDWAASKTALQAWADGEQQATKLDGDLRIGVLSLLTPEQLKTLVSAGGAQIIRGQWKPKINWGLRHKQVSP